MGPGMFDGLFKALFIVGVLVGGAVVGAAWLFVRYVAPHIHLGWS